VRRDRGTDRTEVGFPVPARQLNGLRTTVQRVRTDRTGDRFGRTTRQLEDTAGRTSEREASLGNW